MNNQERSMKVLSQEISEKQSQPQEIERKFLVKSLPENLEQYPHKDIVQGYLAITEDGMEVRLRHKIKNILVIQEIF